MQNPTHTADRPHSPRASVFPLQNCVNSISDFADSVFFRFRFENIRFRYEKFRFVYFQSVFFLSIKFCLFGRVLND